MLPPEAPTVTAPALMLLPPIANVPSFTVSAPLLLPNAVALPAVNVPALTVVPPPYVLAPDKVLAPDPACIKVAELPANTDDTVALFVLFNV